MYEKADAHSKVLFLHSSVHGAEMNKSILTEAVGQCVLLFKKNQTNKKAACLFADCARRWGAECEEPLQE